MILANHSDLVTPYGDFEEIRFNRNKGYTPVRYIAFVHIIM